VANLSRIVTLQNLTITPLNLKDAGGTLAMEATARTYRYLDASEIAAQRKPATGAKPAGGGENK
jgi:type IV pilus assembly protein PilO